MAISDSDMKIYEKVKHELQLEEAAYRLEQEFNYRFSDLDFADYENEFELEDIVERYEEEMYGREYDPAWDSVISTALEDFAWDNDIDESLDTEDDTEEDNRYIDDFDD